MSKNDNINVNDQNEEKIVLSARINKEHYKVSLKLNAELEAPIETAASMHNLTVPQYIELAIRKQLKEDQLEK